MKRVFIDLAGRRVKTFTVEKLIEVDKWKNIWWECRCDCGIVRRLLGQSLRSGGVRCKCQTKPKRQRIVRVYAPELSKLPRQDKHSLHPLYSTWNNMIHRCYNPKCRAFKNYGERGIAVSERWYNIENFIADMGERPKDGTLERIDNDGPYSPDNCKWATRLEQATNKRNNRVLTYRGESATITEWARKLEITLSSMQRRVARGWPEDRLFYKGVVPFDQRNYHHLKERLW
jgi:hypothetical protein